MKNELIPTNCPSCSSELKIEDIHLICDNKNCPAQNIQKILHWITTLKMENIAESTVKTLYENNIIHNVLDLYSLNESKLSGIHGFGDSKISNILNEIERTKVMTIGRFCDAISIDLVGEKAIDKLGIKSEEDLLNFNNPEYVIGQNIISYVKENKKYIKDLLEVVKIMKIKEVITQAEAERICCTGSGPMPRNKLREKIIEKGDISLDNVSKDCTLLVTDDVNPQSSKAIKARKLGIKITSYGEYFKA